MNLIEEYIKTLATEEGIEIHKNKGEDDITLPYGLYKKYDSNMYKGIVRIAQGIGIHEKTSKWDERDIVEVNKLIAPMGVAIKKLAIEFYKDFMEKAHISLYPPECRAIVFSLYANSPYWCTRAVQRAIINMVKSESLGLILSEVSIEDGYWGTKTKQAVDYIKSNKQISFHYYFESEIASNMKSIYIKLWSKEEKKLKSGEVNKYTKVLNGWDERVSKFQTMR